MNKHNKHNQCHMLLLLLLAPTLKKNSSGTNTPGHVENMLGQKNDSPPLDIMKQHLPNLFGQVQNDVFLC